MTVRPMCPFCGVEVERDHFSIFEKEEGWYHELCWWKRECARLTAVIAEMKEEGPEDSDDDRIAHHHHDLSSENTMLAGDEEGEERKVR